MSVILALDGGGDRFSAAVMAGGRVLCRAVAVSAAAPASAVALPLVQFVLSDGGVKLSDCDAFAFAAGPGKFSSLRFVCAIARTFAYAEKKPLVAVPTFAALAEANSAGDAAIKCALPAQRGHVYFAVCARRGGGWRQSMLSVVSVAARPPARRIRAACGEGFVRHPELLAGAALRQTAASSDAAVVVRLAAVMLAAGETTSPLSCEPLYVRHKVAQTSAERDKQRRAAVALSSFVPV